MSNITIYTQCRLLTVRSSCALRVVTTVNARLACQDLSSMLQLRYASPVLQDALPVIPTTYLYVHNVCQVLSST